MGRNTKVINWADRDAELEQLLKMGCGYKEISNFMGVSITSLKRRLIAKGLYSPRPVMKVEATEPSVVDALFKAKKHKFAVKRAFAHRHDIEFTISFDEIVWNTICPIFGEEINYFNKRTLPNSPSFDRVDPTKGYVSGNVQIVSYRANAIKRDGTAEEHRRIADWMEAQQKV